MRYETVKTLKDEDFKRLTGVSRGVYENKNDYHFLDIPLSISGFDEIMETMKTRRPDLAKSLVMDKFKGTTTAGNLISSLICIVVGLTGISNGWQLHILLIILSVYLFLSGIFVLVIFLRSLRSITLGNGEIIITNTLNEKRLPLADIKGDLKGGGILTRNGQIVTFGKVTEGHYILFDNIQAWWRAGRARGHVENDIFQ